jgi:large subunit ribosomal protein L9
MEVMLRQDVENLGEIGDVVEVADGYARNYLLPRRLAVKAAEADLQAIERAREAKRVRALKARERAEEVARQLDGYLCYMPVRVTRAGHLYGSVGPEDVRKVLDEEGFAGLEAARVNMSRPIEETGDYDVEVILHPEVRVEVTVRVAALQEEEPE